MIQAILLSLILLVQPALACRLAKTDRWYWTKSELIKKTRSILLVKVVSATPPQKEPSDRRGWKYKFDVLEVLKGKRSAQVVLDNFEGPSSGAEFNGNMRALYNSACEVAVGFEEGKTYLLFLDSFHPSGYQEIKSQDDPWLIEVRGYFRKK